MKLHIDKKADALYLRFDDSAIVESEEVAPASSSTTTKPTKLSASSCSTPPVALPT